LIDPPDPTGLVDPSPLASASGDIEPRRFRRGPLVAAMVVIGLVALGGFYLVLGTMVNDRMPRQAAVDGVEVGGFTRAEASRALEAAAGRRLTRPLSITGPDGWSVTVTPGKAGFELDSDAALDSIERPGWSPAGLWRWLVEPVDAASDLRVDEARLTSKLASQLAGLAVAPQEPVITLVRRELVLSPGVSGITVDLEQTTRAVVKAVRMGQTSAIASVTTRPPQVSNEEATRVYSRARQLIDRGLTVKKDGVIADVPRRLLARSLAFTAVGGQLRVSVDGERLRERLLKRYPDLEKPPSDARFKIRDGVPAVVPARDGSTVDAADLANGVSTAAASYPASGVVSVPGTPVSPVLTDDRAADLGIRERISSFTQEFPYAAYRVQNIGQAARYVDGTVLLPGETFSMNDTIKERTRDNGYTEGFVIGPGGVFREELGGGVSAATTAVWTAAFFAGMDPVQVRAHSIYIPRYAPGLEATVAWGVFDMQFRNTTPTAVLITARTTDTSMTVEFWGTRQYDKVKAVFGPRKDVVPFTTITDTGDTCLGQGGSDGFHIDVERQFVNDRVVVRSDVFSTTYKPSPQVICG